MRSIQVLLSCSHTFHQACLASYEKFSKTKACPLCRANDYEKRVIEDGRRLWTQRCACRVQSVWKGHKGRREYKRLLDTVVPTDPAKRKAFYGRKVAGLTTRLLDAIDADRDSALDELFAASERAMHMSRAVRCPSDCPAAASLNSATRRSRSSDTARECLPRLPPPLSLHTITCDLPPD